jgi:hypothetical protein
MTALTGLLSRADCQRLLERLAELGELDALMKERGTATGRARRWVSGHPGHRLRGPAARFLRALGPLAHRVISVIRSAAHLADRRAQAR